MPDRNHDLDRVFQRFLIGLAVFILVEPLLLVGVVIVLIERPEWTWLVLVPYLLLTAGALGVGAFYLRRAGLLKLGPSAPMVRRFILGFLVTMAAFIGVAERWPTLVPLWLLLLVVAMVALMVWQVRWQASRLAFRCNNCGAVFAGTVSTWAFSMNLGNHKHVRCASCGHQWAEVISRP